MDLSKLGTSFDYLNAENLENLLQMRRARTEKQQEPVAPPELSSASAAVPASHTTSGNVMNRNFYNDNYEKSVFTMARLESFETEKSFANSLMGMVDTLMAYQQQVRAEMEARSGGGGLTGSMQTGYVPNTLAGLKAYGLTKRTVEEEVSKEAKQHLDETKKAIEEAAQEAMAPKDAEGNPIPTPGVGETPEISVPAPGQSSAAPAAPLPGASAAPLPQAANISSALPASAQSVDATV